MLFHDSLPLQHWPAQHTERMYLHVQDKNEAAKQLYSDMQYELSDSMLRGVEATEQGMEGILFYQRPLYIGIERRW